jgi:S-DNA-T family DNA segregation ATPase FtsK/SpoIIIE
LIKANITSRIALQVASQVDSRTILDMSGAERLLGNGDMLFLAGDAGKPKRIQGGYVSDKEISNVVKFLRKQAGDVEYEEEITAPQPSQYGFDVNTDNRLGLNVDDPLFHEAKDLIVKTGKASASYLQRRFRIGYARAASLLDMLEEAGIIGPVDGSKPREILIGREREDEDLSSEILMEEEETKEEDETEIEDIPKPKKFTKNQDEEEEIDF